MVFGSSSHAYVQVRLLWKGHKPGACRFRFQLLWPWQNHLTSWTSVTWFVEQRYNICLAGLLLGMNIGNVYSSAKFLPCSWYHRGHQYFSAFPQHFTSSELFVCHFTGYSFSAAVACLMGCRAKCQSTKNSPCYPVEEYWEKNLSQG